MLNTRAGRRSAKQRKGHSLPLKNRDYAEEFVLQGGSKFAYPDEHGVSERSQRTCSAKDDA
ncbi:hypothetical protein EB105725_12_00030 [Shimwellia blattae DSM 4481 = NBRC 105725]|nr:hypothetical protein EB105725_12_00030 [Shimwellia blattae DSM 4481 = NBRC 105725]